MQEDPAFAREALQAGASAYVLKEAADDELVGRPRGRVGRHLPHPQLGARIAAAPPEPSGPPDDLTEREVEILRLIALGHTNAEIAAQLYLSVRTVESHRAHIQQKIRLTSRAELVHYALEHGLMTVDRRRSSRPAPRGRGRGAHRRPCTAAPRGGRAEGRAASNT